MDIDGTHIKGGGIGKKLEADRILNLGEMNLGDEVKKIEDEWLRKPLGDEEVGN